uniref:Uncharacterized protein n=1 Tax=Panagrolaimus sp. JU765 TaxID=591449 RepID=A0AC34R866_9BILA
MEITRIVASMTLIVHPRINKIAVIATMANEMEKIAANVNNGLAVDKMTTMAEIPMEKTTEINVPFNNESNKSNKFVVSGFDKIIGVDLKL